MNNELLRNYIFVFKAFNDYIIINTPWAQLQKAPESHKLTILKRHRTCTPVVLGQLEVEFRTILTFLPITFPTVEKNSSRSLGRILAANCIQNTVRASLSSGVRLSIGSLETVKVS